ncbi:hypothetical protein [Streptomyces sp. NPDC058861]|uniref:hypothetical protein n=1 Tax=Streptomyces sp. NPDC058861 TaxID=3346653 RepID=UPI0036CA2B65
MYDNPATPLPLSTSPEYYLRLARHGARSRSLLIGERYRPADGSVSSYLTALYGMALLDAPALEPEPDVVEQLLAAGDQAALDEVDRLYRPLDRAALLLTQVPRETHMERLKAYAARVEGSAPLSRIPLHSAAASQVRGLLAKRPRLHSYVDLPEVPFSASESLLRRVLSHTQPYVNLQGIWRGPDGEHHEISGWTVDEGVYGLQRTVQDPETRQWSSVRDAEKVSVEEDVFLRDYTLVPREPLADPRITRLGTLLDELLAAYEEATGRPPETAEEIRSALAEVKAIPEEARRRRHGSMLAAARRGHQRGRRR